MGRWFKRAATGATPDTAALGSGVIALRMAQGSFVPAGCIGVVFDQGGLARRVAPGAIMAASAHDCAYCFHPGPYSMELTPFAAAPELGLRLVLVVDSPDPGVQQQRFDTYLASEANGDVTLAALAATIEAAVQRELAQGHLELPPCTSLEEWHAFRAGLDRLLYLRFGVTVEDCLPVDLGDRVDYARQLLAAVAPAAAMAPKASAERQSAQDMALADAIALRRLFLELPSVIGALRLASVPVGPDGFRQRQALLHRLDRVNLAAATMPSLGLAAPGKPLGAGQQQVRVAHSRQAVEALDEAWALLARVAATPASDLADDADRIVANLEHHVQLRGLVPESEAA
jgi:hypothetical protein